MRYTVVWLPAADDELALLWIQAQDRQALSNAAKRIEQALRIDPDHKAFEQGGYWYYTDSPLTVAFELSPDDRLVTILQVVLD
jgi:hypothetical protein